MGAGAAMRRLIYLFLLAACGAARPALADVILPSPAPTATETLPTLGTTPETGLTASQSEALKHPVPSRPTPGPAGQATAQPTVVPQLAPAPAASAPVTSTAKTSGFLVGLGLSQYLVNNGSPLAYNFDLGYQFSNNLILRTGADTFFFEGKSGGQTYSYSFNNFTTSLAYLFGPAGPVRPFAGLSMDFVTGQQSPANVASAPVGSAPGGIGGGGLAGLRWALRPGFELQAQAHAFYVVSDLGFVTSFGLGVTWVL